MSVAASSLRERAHGRDARGAERGQKGALGGGFQARAPILERGERGLHFIGAADRPAGERLDTERALAATRDEVAGVERDGRDAAVGGVALSRSSRISPAIARMIASKSPAARRASRVSTLPRSATTSRSGRRRSASKRRRADEVPSRAPFARASSESPPVAREQRVARVGALGHRRDTESRGEQRRQVFHRMHREIDPALDERLLQLLDEEALTADLGERRRGHAVAAGADGNDLDSRRR